MLLSRLAWFGQDSKKTKECRRCCCQLVKCCDRIHVQEVSTQPLYHLAHFYVIELACGCFMSGPVAGSLEYATRMMRTRVCVSC